MNSDDIFVYYWNSDNESIRCYGIDKEGNGVALIIPDFTPYVYIELPKNNVHSVETELRHELRKYTILMEIVEKKHLYSMKGIASFLYCQCENRSQIVQIVHIIKTQKFSNYKLTVHEESATDILQLTCLRKVPMATWMSFSGVLLEGDDKFTRADKEYMVKWKQIGPSTKTGCVHPKVLAFDIEVNSDFVNSMPCNRPADVIFQISCVVEQNNVRVKHLLTIDGIDLDTSNLLDGINVYAYDSEEELLKGFINFLIETKPNVLTGYNILMFDITYIIQRCERYGLLPELRDAGWNRSTLAQSKSIKWSSSAYQNQEYSFIDWEGILILDLLPLIKRDYKFDNYKLDTVAQNLVGAEKDPVDYKDIFKAYRTKEMARVGKYCVQDSNLCIDLLNYIHCWISLSEMAVVCKVPMFTLYTQGQQFKIYSQVYDYCIKKNIIVTSNGYECAAGERYRGAYVMDPIPGYYENIVPLDFASLYPSVIIAYNICYSTFVSDTTGVNPNDYNTFEWEDHVGCDHDPKMIKVVDLTRRIDEIGQEITKLMMEKVSTRGLKNKATLQEKINKLRSSQKPLREERVEYKKSKPGEWEDDDGNAISGVMCAKRKYSFIKREIKPGVIPTIIQNLLDSRAVVKKEMKTCSASEKIVLDKKQSAYKVSANSQYGAMGVRRGYLAFMPAAMCVTYLGRESILKAGQIACKDYGAKWIYTDTDSTYVIFPHLTTSQDIWDYAIHVAEQISLQFPKSVNIEFEQAIYNHFLILSKKRYMYYSIDREGKCDGKIGNKGIVLARRDNAIILKLLYSHIVKMIFDKQDKKDIEYYTLTFINNIYRNVIPYQHYVATKSIKSIENNDEEEKIGNYKVRALPKDPEERLKVLNGMTEREYLIQSCPAQVQLAERMKIRGFPVDVGSRMEYVVLDRKSKTLGKKMEDYDYFMKRKRQLKLDKNYYLKSLVTPIDQLLFIATGIDKFVENQLKIRISYEQVVKSIKALFSPKFV